MQEYTTIASPSQYSPFCFKTLMKNYYIWNRAWIYINLPTLHSMHSVQGITTITSPSHYSPFCFKTLDKSFYILNYIEQECIYMYLICQLSTACTKCKNSQRWPPPHPPWLAHLRIVRCFKTVLKIFYIWTRARIYFVDNSSQIALIARNYNDGLVISV